MSGRLACTTPLSATDVKGFRFMGYVMPCWCIINRKPFTLRWCANGAFSCRMDGATADRRTGSPCWLLSTAS